MARDQAGNVSLNFQTPSVWKRERLSLDANDCKSAARGPDKEVLITGLGSEIGLLGVGIV